MAGFALSGTRIPLYGDANEMIIATAGHVDHGKTTLLQALTGINADRLPEEKKRGVMTASWRKPKNI